MKAKMIVPYRFTWLFLTGAVVLLICLGLLSAYFIKENNGGYAFLCLLIAAIIPIALGFLFNYGIRINRKRVIVIEQSQMKIFPYDEVRRITVKFTNDRVTALIKMMDNQEHIFVWDHIFFGYNAWFPSMSQVNANIKADFVSKSIASLSACEKVVAQDCRKTK